MLQTSAIKKYWVYIPIIVFPFIAYWQIGLMHYTMKWDMLDQFFPYRYFISECYNAGCLPSWNPYQHLGWPFHADPQSGFWYPVSWLLTVFRGYDIYTMNFEFILHICIGGIGFFTLLRGLDVDGKVALLFSLAFQCCGVFVSNAQHLTWIVGVAWMPLVVHHYLRMFNSDSNGIRHAIATGFFMMLMLTGGYPVFTIITNYFFAAIFLIAALKAITGKNYKQAGKIIGLNSMMYGVFLTLSSGYLVSFLQALPYISRGTPLTIHEVMEGQFPAKALVSILFPFAVTKNDGFFSTDLSMLNVYFGLTPLIFALCSFLIFKNYKARLFIIFGIISLMVALGDVLPVRGLLYDFLPMMDKFRFPSIFRVFFMFSFLVAAAIAMQESLKKWDNSRRIYWRAALILCISTIAFHFHLLGKASYFVKFPSLFDVTAYLAFLQKSNIYQRIAIQSLVQFALLLLILSGIFLIKDRAKTIAFILVITVIDLFLSVQFNIPATAISNTRASDFQRSLSEMPKGFPLPAMQPIAEVPAYDKRLYPSWYNQNIFTKQISHEGFNSFYLRDYMTFFDSPQRDSILKNPLVFAQPSEAAKTLSITAFNPNEVEVKLSLENEARLTMLQSRYVGWSATIDGKTVSLESSPLPFLSINVPLGNHEVRFRYSPGYLKPLIIISITSFIAALFFLLYPIFRRLFLLKPGAAHDGKIPS